MLWYWKQTECLHWQKCTFKHFESNSWENNRIYFGFSDKNALPEMDFTEMKVPRRPKWDHTTTPAELNAMEKESFLSWRRDIAM